MATEEAPLAADYRSNSRNKPDTFIAPVTRRARGGLLLASTTGLILESASAFLLRIALASRDETDDFSVLVLRTVCAIRIITCPATDPMVCRRGPPASIRSCADLRKRSAKTHSAVATLTRCFSPLPCALPRSHSQRLVMRTCYYILVPTTCPGPGAAGDSIRGPAAELLRRARAVAAPLRALGAEEQAARVRRAAEGQPHLRSRPDRDAVDCASSARRPTALGPARVTG